MIPKLEKEYTRWRGLLPASFPESRYCVGPDTVLRAHYLIAEYFISIGEEGDFLDIGPRSMDLLMSAVSRQFVGIGSQRKWNSLFEITATLFYGLIKNHAFHDANKRTALLVALHQLAEGKRMPNVKHNELDELAVRTAENRLDKYADWRSFRDKPDPEVTFIARKWKRMTREVSSTQYCVTFRQLDTILHRWNAHLEVASGNRADVIQVQEERVGLLKNRKTAVERRVLQIGFHAWTSQVSERDIKAVRSALQLTNENGIDNEVFFHGADQIEFLIDKYSGPLKRLRNK